MEAMFLRARRSMLRLLKEWFWDVDEAPDHIGPIGLYRR
jgi:hypothetical protein